MLYPSNWQPVLGLALDIGVGPDGNPFAIGTDHQIWELVAPACLAYGGSGVRLAVGPKNQVFHVNAAGLIFRSDGVGTWTQLPGPAAADIGVGPDGSVWIACGNTAICKWNGQAFVGVVGHATRIAVGPDGRAFIVGTDGRIYYGDGQIWSQFPSPASWAADVGVGADGSVWAAGTDGLAYLLNLATGTMTATGITALNISVGPDGRPWVTRPGAVISVLSPSALASPGRDFVASLFWRYLGRNPTPTELENNFERLVNGSITRTALEAEFHSCPEAYNHSGFYDRDFVNYLFQRYLARAPANADEFFYHVRRLYPGDLTRDALENEFCTCPEALRCGTVSNNNFVWSLCWLYLGHAPPADGLAYHVGRLANNQITRAALQEEFRTCPEAQQHGGALSHEFAQSLYLRHLGRWPTAAEMVQYDAELYRSAISRDALDQQFHTCPEAVAYQGSFPPLQVLGAAYTGMPPGQEDVTSTVGAWVFEDRICRNFTAASFGTQGDSHHILTIVYRYGAGKAKTVAFPTGIPAVVSPHPDDLLPPGAASQPSPVAPAATQLIILGATYGRSDVTATAVQLVAADRLYADASDGTWGYAGPSAVLRNLVVVYQVGSGPPTVLVAQNGERAYIGASTLNILGAAYGNVNVTASVSAKARYGALRMVVDQTLTSQVPWPPASRSLTVVYRYAGGPVHTAAVLDGQTLLITPETVPSGGAISLASTSPSGLRILGATYGLRDVTLAAQGHCQNDLLCVSANIATWGDGLPGASKTLVVVYQIDGGRPIVHIAKQDETLAIGAPIILGAAYGPLDVTDKVASLVRAGNLSILVNSLTFGDSLIGMGKALLVVYRYANEPPRVSIAGDNSALVLSTDPPEGTMPTQAGLQILGAAYGLLDVSDLMHLTDPSFVISLFWRYLGRTPSDADIAAHLSLLTSGQKTRATLEALVASCPEAAAHARFVDHDFVASLFARYLGRDPAVAPDLAYHFQRVLSGQITASALEVEFANCAEAHAHGPVTNANFVTSLYWRYLGRTPDPPGLAVHVGRLTSGQITRAALETEFQGCPEGLAHAHMLDQEFVTSLFWRYLGRTPDPGGLATHLNRISSGQTTRDALAIEFRYCQEAQQHRVATPSFRAHEATWGDGWPGISRKTLAIVYQVDQGPPQVATAVQGELLTLPLAPPRATAYIEAEIRLLADYQVAPATTVNVTGPGIVVPCRGAGVTPPSPGTVFLPQHKGVYQVVLTPRQLNGTALPAGAQLTLLCDQGVSILSDQSGQTVRYVLAPQVPLQFVVPASGRCRFSIEPIDGQLSCPLLRARWDQLPPNAWAVIRPDQDLHERLTQLTPDQLLQPPAGKSSPLAQAGNALSLWRAHTINSAVLPGVTFLRGLELRLLGSDGSLRLPIAVDLGATTVPANSTAIIPPHVVVPPGASCTRGMRTGAATLAFSRLVQRSQGGPVSFSIFDDIGDAFSSAFSAVSSGVTSAFQVVANGVTVAVNATAEGFNTLVHVAEQSAQQVASFTDDQCKQAQCLVIDTSNGLVAYAVMAAGSGSQILKTAIGTIEDAARILASMVVRLALQIKDIIEFLLMMLNWGDVLETQRYLAQSVNTILDLLPTTLSSAATAAQSALTAVANRLPLLGASPTSGARPSLQLGPLGDVWNFLSDRMQSFAGSLTGVQWPDVQLQASLATPALAAFTSALIAPLVGVTALNPSQLASQLNVDPGSLLALVANPAQVALNRLAGKTPELLQICAAVIPSLKSALNSRVYIPVLTELIETFVLGGSQLTLLSLITLLAGAAYTFVYKTTQLSSTGPAHNAPPITTRQVTVPVAAFTVSATPVTASTSSAPAPIFPLPQVARIGLQVVQGVLRFVASTYQNPTLLPVASGLGIMLALAWSDRFGDFWPSELTFQLANLGSTVTQAFVQDSGQQVLARSFFGICEAGCAVATCVGVAKAGQAPTEIIWLRAISELATALVDLQPDLPAVGALGPLASISLGMDMAVRG